MTVWIAATATQRILRKVQMYFEVIPSSIVRCQGILGCCGNSERGKGLPVWRGVPNRLIKKPLWASGITEAEG